MIRSLVVAQHEYLTNVRRKEFILITVGLPVLILVFASIGALGTGVAVSQIFQRGAQKVGVVDSSGLLRADRLNTSESEDRLVPFSDIESGKQAVKEGKVRALIVVDRDYLDTGHVEVYRKGGGLFNMANRVPVGSILTRALLERSGANPRYAERIEDPTGRTGANVYVLDKSGKFAPLNGGVEAARFVVPYLFSIMLVSSIFISASYLLRGIADEKENRIIEVILSSVTTEELLKGKLIGLAAVGLTQVGVWMAFAAIPAMVMFTQYFHLSAVTLLGVVLFFGLGFGLFATMMAGLGALGTSYRETQQISGLVSLLAFFPFTLLTVILEFPNGGLARTLSYVPFTAPTTMVLRLTAADIPPTDIVVSAISIVLATWLILKVSARLFRFGLLVYGKRPGLRETLRWLRQS